jgi:hypothetical protein
VSVRGLKQLVVPDRVIFVAPDGGAPAWARTAERNLFAGRFAGERLALGTLGEAPAAAVLPGVDALPVGGRLFLALVALPQPDPAGLIGGSTRGAAGASCCSAPGSGRWRWTPRPAGRSRHRRANSAGCGWWGRAG